MKFLFEALAACVAGTKLRGSSTHLHGVSQQSRVFDPSSLFEAFAVCVASTKLRGLLTHLHGVSQQSRVFDPSSLFEAVYRKFFAIVLTVSVFYGISNFFLIFVQLFC